MNNDVSTLIMSLVAAVSVVGIIIYIIMAASLWKLFKDKGEKGYKAIIPLYNIYVLMKLVSMPGWMLILYFIPIVNLFALAFLSVRVANTYEKGAGFAIGLLFFPFIFYPLLAFSHAKEEGLEEKVESKTPPEENTKICPICGTALASDATSCFVCGESLEEKKETIHEDIQEEANSENNISMDKEEPFEVPSLSFDFTEPDTEEHFEEKPFIFKEEPSFTVEESLEKNRSKEEDPFPVHEEPSFTIEEPLEKSLSQEEMPSMESILKVDTDYVPPKKTSTPKYKSTTKTLDEILRINSDLYAAQEADRVEREKQKRIEEEKERAEKVEKQADELLRMIEEAEKRPVRPIIEEREVPMLEPFPIKESVTREPLEEPEKTPVKPTILEEKELLKE